MVVVVVLAMSGYFFVQRQAPQPEEGGEQFVLQHGPEQVTFIKGERYQEEGVVVGGDAQPPTFYDGTLTLLPMAKARELTLTYGNIRECVNAGKYEAQAAAKEMFLIAANDRVKGEIKSVLGLAIANLHNGNRKIPLIRIDTVRLRKISDVIILGDRKVPAPEDMASAEYYLVNDIQTMEEDFSGSP